MQTKNALPTEVKAIIANRNSADYLNLKRPVQVLIRDKRNRVYNPTIIYVESTDPRSDREITQEFKLRLEAGKRDIQDKQNSLKLANAKLSWDRTVAHGPLQRG